MKFRSRQMISAFSLILSLGAVDAHAMGKSVAEIIQQIREAGDRATDNSQNSSGSGDDTSNWHSTSGRGSSIQSDEKGNLRIVRKWISPSNAYQPRTKQQCTTVAAHTGAISRTPRHQGQSGYCFAYAAADMLSQHLGEEISAVDLAFSYFRDTSSRGSLDNAVGLSGGQPDRAALSAASKGFCRERNLPSSGYAERYLSNPAARASLGADAEVYIRAGVGWQLVPRQFQDFRGLLASLSSFHKEVRNGSSVDMNSTYSDLAILFPRLSEREFASSVERTRNLSEFEFVDDLLSEICGSHRIRLSQRLESEVTYLSGSTTANGFALFPIVDEALNRGQMVTISYFVDGIVAAASAEQLGFNPGQAGMGHASNIVGRRFNDRTQECEYLVRNTWGKSCSGYNDEYLARCSNGSLWVGENYLKDTLFSTFTLK